MRYKTITLCADFFAAMAHINAYDGFYPLPQSTGFSFIILPPDITPKRHPGLIDDYFWGEYTQRRFKAVEGVQIIKPAPPAHRISSPAPRRKKRRK